MLNYDPDRFRRELNAQVKKNIEDNLLEAILSIKPDAENVGVDVDMETGKIIIEGVEEDVAEKAILLITKSSTEKE